MNLLTTADWLVIVMVGGSIAVTLRTPSRRRLE